MAERKFETTAAFKELIDLVRDSDALFLEGPRAVDAPSVLEGYRWLTEILSVALDCYLWADDEHPTFIPIVGPTRKFGGDNADAIYSFAPLHPERSYRIRGVRGDACYLALTVYGGPRDGRWSDRIVATLNDRAIQFAPDGSFEVRLSAQEQPGHLDPARPGQRVRGHARLSRAPESGTPRELHDRVPRHAAAAAALGRGSRAPLPRRRELHPRHAQDHAAAARPCEAQPDRRALPGAAAHLRLGGGGRRLRDGKLRARRGRGARDRGRAPRCVFWNVCLWNPYLQTYDYRYEQVTLNGGQVRYEPDGSYRIVIAARDPGVPNWISTADHPRGRIWFRWFLPESPPSRPQARVVPLAQLAHSSGTPKRS